MQEIGKLISILVVLSLLVAPVMAEDNLNTEVNELREHVFLLFSFGNNSQSSFLVHNSDARQQFLSMQVIPAPGDLCRSQRMECNQSLYDPYVKIHYNGNSVIADTRGCWNWWNVSIGTGFLGVQEMEENKTLCPVVSIPYTPQDGVWNITFNTTTDSGLAALDIGVRVFDYSTAYTDKEIRYSATADESISNVGTLLNYQINFWKLVYYSVVIALVVFGTLLVVGGLPIAIKWITSKMKG